LNETIDRVNTLVRYCGALTREGGTCRQIVGLDSTSGLCPFHDPARAEEVTEMRRRGAQAGNATRAALADLEPPDLEPTLDGIVRHGKWVLDQLGRGRIDPKVASSMTYGLQQMRQALIQRDLENEVKTLRAMVKELKQRRAA
jgi:hypothetical protein